MALVGDHRNVNAIAARIEQMRGQREPLHMQLSRPIGHELQRPAREPRCVKPGGSKYRRWISFAIRKTTPGPSVGWWLSSAPTASRNSGRSHSRNGAAAESMMACKLSDGDRSVGMLDMRQPPRQDVREAGPSPLSPAETRGSFLGLQSYRMACARCQWALGAGQWRACGPSNASLGVPLGRGGGYPKNWRLVCRGARGDENLLISAYLLI